MCTWARRLKRPGRSWDCGLHFLHRCVWACSWHRTDTEHRLLDSANDDVKFEANSQGFPRVGEPLGRFNSSKVAAPEVPDATVNYAE